MIPLSTGRMLSGGTAWWSAVRHSLIILLMWFGRRYSVSSSGFSGIKLLALTGELESLNTK